jgi:cation-transporting ATPase E
MSLEIGYLVFRNIFILINLIIFIVVAFLIYFGDTREGVFLGVIISINILMGIIQDVNAWIVLERLQMLTALKVLRVNSDGTESLVLPEELQKNDLIKLKLGDQAPCDGVVIDSKSLEISEAIITGESNSFTKSPGDKILAGSVITAGFGTERIETVFRESRIAKMTARIKRYSVNISPIQRDINKVVSYSGYVLLAVLVFVVIRGILTDQARVEMIRMAGALSSILVPQGLVVATTLLFAYGGIHFYRRHVLLREVNATEKLAHIKNLCLDKTGTLTENELTVEEMFVPSSVAPEDAKKLAVAYMCESGDSSQLVHSIRDFLASPDSGEMLEAVSFSSWRQYGGIRVRINLKNLSGNNQENRTEEIVLAGTPEVFLPYFSSKFESDPEPDDKKWLNEIIEKNASKGKRVFCVVRASSQKASGKKVAEQIITDQNVAAGQQSLQSIPGHILQQVPQELSKDIVLSPIAVFILKNELRPGIREAVDFFQKRGVRLRILSGDNTDTIRAVVASAGIAHPEALITGVEMESWTQEDFDQKAKDYSVFARIMPEQKEKIILALKKDGFTAMVGDGANDALAIKRADLGIAMFDGTPATRQIAAVILLHNSFTELPGGVRLADSIVEKIEMYGAIFFNQTFLGFFLFVILTAFGYTFPFSPLNISFANYFTVGLPALLISYWAIRPAGETHPPIGGSFLKRILLFSLASSALGSVMAAGIFIFIGRQLVSAQSVVMGQIAGVQGTQNIQTLIVFTFIFFGFVFFLFTPGVYSNTVYRSQRFGLLIFGLFESFLLLLAFSIPLVRQFFDLSIIPLSAFITLLPVLFMYCIAQYFIARQFSFRK